MVGWNPRISIATPEIRAQMDKRSPRAETLELQQAIEDLTGPDQLLELDLPEGGNPNSVKARVKSAANGIGKYVKVQVVGNTIRVMLSEPPPPLPEGRRRGGRPRKQPVEA